MEKKISAPVPIPVVDRPFAMSVEEDTGSITPTYNITEDTEVAHLELEVGVTIRHRGQIITVARAGMYRISPKGITKFALRETM